MKLAIRDMRLSDLDQVLALEKLSFPTPWSREIFKREVEREFDGIYLVADMEGKVLGYMGMIKILDVGHITTLAVHPRYRKKGISIQLMLELISKARKTGTRYLTLEVRESNDIAQKLYRKFGFTEVGKRKEYYIDNREDAVIMWSGDVQNSGYEKLLDGIGEAIRNEI